MNRELKLVFRNSLITLLIIFIYGLIIWNKAVFIGASLGAVISIFNLYLIFKDAEVLIHVGENLLKKRKISYMKRFFISGLFLYLMIKVDFQWFVSGALGLFVVKLNIILLTLSMQFNNILNKSKM